MANVHKQPISLGNRGVGSASVVGGAIRGEGGPLHPHLVVPLTFNLNSLPAEAMVAVVRVKATLSADQNAFPRDALCGPAIEDLTDGFPVRTLPDGGMEHLVEMRFSLSSAEVEHMESLRQTSRESTFRLYVGVQATVAGLQTYNQMTPGKAPAESPWEMGYGMFSQVLPFWTCRIMPILVEIDQSTWIENVLPGLGYDRLRLMEMTFPPPLPDHTSAAAQFDRAKQALDQRRYSDCIQACRGLMNMWERQYGATQDRHVAEFVADERGWPANDIRRKLLDNLWKEVGNIANASHHPEGHVDTGLFGGQDARFMLVLTAALCEYISRD